MSRQVDIYDDFYLVGHATVINLTPITYNGLQIKSTVVGSLTIDGIVPAVFAIALVKNQADPKQNGIYRIQNNGTAPGSMYQLDRVKETCGFRKGKPIYVLNGIVNEKTGWVTVHTDDYTVTGVTDIEYCPIAGTGAAVDVLVAYTLVDVQAKALKTTWTTIAEFPWLHSRYSTYTTGAIVTRVTIDNRDISIRLRDADNAITLGQVINVNTSGSLSFPVINPTGDTKIQLQVMKSANGGTHPQLHGAALEYIKP